MITKRKARLCAQTEIGLITDSLPSQIATLNTGQLKRNVKRARNLRDKYRSVAARQRREAIGKEEARRARPAQSGQNTERKAQLFAETLDRFIAQLATH